MLVLTYREDIKTRIEYEGVSSLQGVLSDSGTLLFHSKEYIT